MARALLEKHRGLIFRKTQFIKEYLNSTSEKEIVERTDKEFKDLVLWFSAKNSKESGLGLYSIYFRRMRTKLARCSSKKNLTINWLMKHYPNIW